MAALSPDTILLTGRVAVVTGAAGGVGRAIAEAFAAFGAHVAACDRDRPHGELAMTVRDQVAVEVFAEAVRERWGRVDVLVNNPGGSPDFAGGFADISPRGERLLIEEHFTQVTRMIRTMLPLMRPGASIVTVLPREPRRGAPVHAAMTAALESLTRTLAAELAPRGIRVNAILRTENENPRDARLVKNEHPRDARSVEDASPRDAQDESLCGAAVFLAGGLARFVTGTTVHVDAWPTAPGDPAFT